MSVFLSRDPRHFHPSPSGESGSGIRFRHLASLVLLWLTGSIALLLFRPGYGFPPFELLDSWIYTGYKWDLLDVIVQGTKHILDFAGHVAE